MLCNFSYDDLYTIVNCLRLIRAVYGRDDFEDVIDRVQDIIDYMDTAPVTEVYPNLK